MRVEVLIQTFWPNGLLATAGFHTDQAGLWGWLVKVLAVWGWWVLYDLPWLLTSLTEVGAKWWGLRGVGLLWRPSAYNPTVELWDFLDGRHVCRAYASESSCSVLTSHGQPLARCCFCLYWRIITNQTAMVKGCLWSFLLLVALLGFLSPSFVLARCLGGLACWLDLAWGAACSLLRWLVSAADKMNRQICWNNETQVTQRERAVE